MHFFNLYSVKYNLKKKQEKNQNFHVEETGTLKEKECLWKEQKRYQLFVLRYSKEIEQTSAEL